MQLQCIHAFMPQVGPTTKHWHMMEHAPGHLIIIVKVAMMFMFDLMTMTLRQAWTWSSCRRDLRRRVLEHLSLTFSCWNISVQQPNPGTGEWVQPFFVLLALATRKPDLQGEIQIWFRGSCNIWVQQSKVLEHWRGSISTDQQVQKSSKQTAHVEKEVSVKTKRKEEASYWP